MILKSITYSEYTGLANEWTLNNLTLGQINLIVGKNAIGKTRTLNVISSIGRLFSGKKAFFNSEYIVELLDNKSTFKYSLSANNLGIIYEKLDLNGESKLNRDNQGEGSIYAVEEKKKIKFKIPQTLHAIITKRDIIQHPYIENLFNWGSNLRHFSFGSDFGSTKILFDTGNKSKDLSAQEDDTPLTAKVAYLGIQTYTDFKKSVIDDMNYIGYQLTDVGVDIPENMNFESNIPIDLKSLKAIYVKEEGLECKVFQGTISQGMFRALALIIHLNYYKLSGFPSCILIDDIGEGLDFERSKALIQLIIDKVKDTSVQLIMSTNDRFIMNSVPLEYWNIIKREDGKCENINYRNSKEIFDNFKFYGLSNFDFFTGNYYEGETNA